MISNLENLDNTRRKVVSFSERGKKLEDEEIEASIQDFMIPIVNNQNEEKFAETFKVLENKLKNIYSIGELSQIKEAMEALAGHEKNMRAEKSLKPGTAGYKEFGTKIDRISGLLLKINERMGKLPKPKPAEIIDFAKQKEEIEYRKKMEQENKEFLEEWNKKEPDEILDGLDGKSS